MPVLRGLQANVADPLLTVQLTSFRCGGVVLGVSFHHLVTDGAGFFNFMAAWAALARSWGALAEEPSRTPGGSPMQGMRSPGGPACLEAPIPSPHSEAPSTPSQEDCAGALLEPSHDRHLLLAR